MIFHSNAATNLKQRTAIRHSPQPYRVLAAHFCVSLATVHHWKQRDTPHDGSCRPHTIHYALAPEEERLVLALRQQRLSLDAIVEALAEVLPHIRRSSVARLLQREGLNRLPPREPQASGEPGTFKEYGPGYLHIDCFYLPKLDGARHYCFVAVDRATRLVFLWIYEHKDKEAATDFLARCLNFYPFKIEKILTDNGREFTLKGFKNRYGSHTKKEHPFTQLCAQHQIEHRQTKPYTPQTNGLAERTNGLVKQDTVKEHTYEHAPQMKEDLHAWFVRYNFYRPHRRLGRKTPYEAVCAWYDKQPELFIKEPAHLLSYRSQSGGT
jgi:transposase InsO family protein